MLPPMICPLGTVISLLSALRIVVAKTWTPSTVPATPPASTKSPDLKGRNSISITPAAKFPSEPWRAKPTARPAAAMTAANEVVLIPS